MLPRLGIDAQLGRAAAWAAAAALTLAAYAALYEIRTYDTLFHLAAGRYIIEHGQLPLRDPFSFTHRGAPWMNHSSAFQILLAGLYQLGGFGLLSVYQACLAALLLALALYGLRGVSQAQFALGALLAALPYCAFREVLEARPHVLGFVCLSGVLLLALHAHDTGRARSLAWGVPLYAAWAGSHGSHVLAYAVFGLAAAYAAVRGARALFGGYLALSVACLLIMGIVAPWALTQGVQHAGSSFLESAVAEWLPLTAADVLGTWPGRSFALLWLVAALGAARVVWHRKRSKTPTSLASLYRLILLGLLLLLALSSRRMVALFMFGGAPLWLPYAVHALSTPFRLAAPARWTWAACAAGWIALFALTHDQRATFRTGAGLQHERFPIAAVAAMRSSGRVQRLYNAYNFGGYLMFAGVPASGVFVDGRAITVYPAEFLGEFQAAYSDAVRFERLAARFACDAVLLPAGSARTWALRDHLQAGAAWRLTYRDAVAELYERASQPVRH